MSIEIVEIAARHFPLIWPVIKPALRAGDSFALPNDEDAARAMWNAPGRKQYAAFEGERVVGTYFMGPNQQGPGAHVANAGYIVAPDARGKGLAKQMCLHSLDRAREQGFKAMQFNIVVATNTAAVRAWIACGFKIIGTLPHAYNHAQIGYVDAYVMHRTL
ncbi:MAG TPA: GNAT family N-acetyltransferase [Caulobacterales bacterium]|nr:GNAT family N-acetyltransferase [Caulobacterales bacterium]